MAVDRKTFICAWWEYHDEGGHSTTIYDARRAYRRYVEDQGSYAFLQPFLDKWSTI